LNGRPRLSIGIPGWKPSAARFSFQLSIVLAVGVFALSCSSSAPARDENTELTPSATFDAAAATTTGGTIDTTTTPLATSTRTAGIAYPDATLTPGDVLPVTAAQVCQSGYSSSVRSVTDSTKNKVYAEYHITSHPTGAFEVDHLISLELGGSNDIKNLWPEPADPRPGFHDKDQLENKLHSLVCAGRMDLVEAQREIVSDWYAAYVTLVLGPATATPTSAPSH
jgi:hypothetical protein